MQIVLERPAPVDQLMALAGVRLVSVDADGRRVKLAVRGPLQPLLRAVSQLPLADLIYGPPDLEDVFMDYYGRDQALPATEAEAAS
jgi:hypothetical protein